MRMEIIRERPAESSRLRERPSEAEELRARLRPLPATSTTASTALLSDRCNVCSQNLRTCIEAIRQGANSHKNLFEKLRLRAIENRLDEHRIRFDIWRSDCAVTEGWLSAINTEQETGLYKLINALFVQLNTSLNTLLDPISQIKQCNKSLGEGDLIGHFDGAEREVLAICDNLTEQLHELAELQPSIQMAQAIHLEQGPYASLRQGIVQIGSKFQNEKQTTSVDEHNDSAAEDTASQISADECPKCMQRVPYHALAFHDDSCHITAISDNAMGAPSGKHSRDNEMLGELKSKQTVKPQHDSVSTDMAGFGTAETVIPTPIAGGKYVRSPTVTGSSSRYGGQTLPSDKTGKDDEISRNENLHYLSGHLMNMQAQ